MNIIKQDGGGSSWNVLFNLSKNLNQKCYGFGTRGNDAEGDLAVNTLQNAGINTDYIEYESKSTNVMNIIIPTGKLDDNDVIHTWFSPITKERTINFSSKLPVNIPKALEDKDLYVILNNFRKVNMDFIDNIKSKKVCLDVGHVRFIRYFKKDYLLRFLKRANVLLLNDTTSRMLYKKLGIKNEKELFSILHLDLFILTAGKNTATFIIKENDNQKIIYKNPIPVEDIIDTTGAGDAFFATILKEYAYADKIDENFVDRAFNLASKNARFVITHMGARLDWD